MAGFSKKTYVLVANSIFEQIEDERNHAESTPEMLNNTDVLERLAVRLAGLFGADNPQFDWHRFYTACGLDADKLLSEEA